MAVTHHDLQGRSLADPLSDRRATLKLSPHSPVGFEMPKTQRWRDLTEELAIIKL